MGYVSACDARCLRRYSFERPGSANSAAKFAVRLHYSETSAEARPVPRGVGFFIVLAPTFGISVAATCTLTLLADIRTPSVLFNPTRLRFMTFEDHPHSSRRNLGQAMGGPGP
jgi:hypothetical protein